MQNPQLFKGKTVLDVSGVPPVLPDGEGKGSRGWVKASELRVEETRAETAVDMEC